MRLSVFVAQITHSKAMNGEIWVTSDGRAYLVGLQGDDEEGSDQGHSKVSFFVL